MATVATTRMSSKGQVVIPEKVRRALRLETGTHFVVVADGDTVILQPITPPSAEQCAPLIEQARHHAHRDHGPLSA
jgi:AbrB family looped-hinge helix DNA binding protein